MTRTITTYTVTYAPWEEGQDEPTKLDTFTDVLPVEINPWDEDSTIVGEAVDILRTKVYATEPSCSQWASNVWYSAEPYQHPYSGNREEVTAHLNGFTDEESRAIYAAITARQEGAIV